MGDNENDRPAEKLAEAIEADRGTNADADEPDTLEDAVSDPDHP